VLGVCALIAALPVLYQTLWVSLCQDRPAERPTHRSVPRRSAHVAEVQYFTMTIHQQFIAPIPKPYQSPPRALTHDRSMRARKPDLDI
jgi:hypothetical protein